MVGPRLQPGQAQPTQHLADRPLVHDHPVPLGNRCRQVEAAPTGHTVDRRIGTGEHQSLQLLHLLRRQCRWTAAAMGIAQPADTIVIIAVNPVAQRLAIHAAGRCRFRPRRSFEHKSDRQYPASLPTVRTS